MSHTNAAHQRPKRPTRERMDYHTEQARRQAASRGRTWQRTSNKRQQPDQYASL